MRFQFALKFVNYTPIHVGNLYVLKVQSPAVSFTSFHIKTLFAHTVYDITDEEKDIALHCAHCIN